MTAPVRPPRRARPNAFVEGEPSEFTLGPAGGAQYGEVGGSFALGEDQYVHGPGGAEQQ
jgi:hypothetical protein